MNEAKNDGVQRVKTKEYLMQVIKSKRAIKFYEDRIIELHHQAAGIRAITYDGDKVQTTPADTMPDIMAQILDVERKYNKAILHYHEVVQRIGAQVDGLENPAHAQILTLRYLTISDACRTLSFADIAAIMGRSEGRIIHLHGEALEAFRRKYRFCRQ